MVAEFVSFVDFAPTFLEVAGIEAGEAGMESPAGRSLCPVFKGETEAGRNWIVFGQERHDLGRPGDAGYPVRGCVEGDFLLVRNLAPERWPMCDPVTGYLNTDGSPTKTWILNENRRGVNHWRWELNFGRRPAEELYDLAHDPDCLTNLTDDPAHARRLAAMRVRLAAELRRLGDPRADGGRADFDHYPAASPNRGFYRRYVEEGERGFNLSWVDAGDFEAAEFDPERPNRKDE
jgi:arylsulfatase A-like enzyme